MAGVLVKLKSYYPSLSKSEKRVSDYIFRKAEKVPFESVYEVARASRVSIATVIRLSQKLGYAQFKAFKVELGQDVPSMVTSMYQAIGPNDTDTDIIKKVVLGNARSLEEMLKVLDLSGLIRAARTISTARRVVFFGAGGSGNLGRDAALQFAHIRVPAEAYGEAYEAFVHALSLTKKDVAIGISHSGRSAMTVQCLKFARQKGALTVGIANYLRSPLHNVSDLFFCTVFPKGRLEAVSLSARVAQCCLIDALYLLVARHKREIGDVEALDRVLESLIRIPEK